jgi:hypothetical protein
MDPSNKPDPSGISHLWLHLFGSAIQGLSVNVAEADSPSDLVTTASAIADAGYLLVANRTRIATSMKDKEAGGDDK